MTANATIPLPVLSAWDPRATSSGSIDPLGALRAYTALATTLLPGVTTVTTRARYLSWVCAGLRLLDESQDAPHGGKAGRARRKRILAWERLVALAACRYASSIQAGIDHPSWSQLRGVRYVRRAITSGKRSSDYDMLRNQPGVGGVGTYWAALVNGGLVEDDSAELTARGEALADAFLASAHTPTHEALRGSKPFDLDALARWGATSSLDTGEASDREKTLLADALLEPETHRRMAGALAGKRASSSDTGFRQLGRALSAQRDPLATRLAATVAVARTFESLHAALLDRFDRLRTDVSRGHPIPLATAVLLVGHPGDLSERGDALEKALKSPDVPPAVASAVRGFLLAVQPVLRTQDATGLTTELLRHHDHVQGGKFDASRQPKQAWVELRGEALIVAPRFALLEPPKPRPAGSFTHPYRVEQFAGMLSEVDGWPEVA